MNIPKIDLKELEKMKQDNFRERLEFIEKYVEWIKKTSNKEWSSQQKDLIG
ncbi:MAG: hypothetical protein J7J89_06460 [Thermoplasmata archaeon]|nr:hypothetical protein [Thermoplasmata archaeon]